MAKIIRCEDDVVEKIPNIMGHVYEYFQDKPLIVYAVLDDDNKLSFIVKDFNNCIYVKAGYKDYDITPFRLRDDGTVEMIRVGDNSIFFKCEEDALKASEANKRDYVNDVYMVDDKGIEQAIGIRKLAYPDTDEYDGFVYYVQYNRNNDTMCDIRFQQMYREVDGKVPIYGFHTKKIDVLSIDEKYSKYGNDKFGLLGPNSKYYSRYEFDRSELGYTLTSIKDYGLIETISKGAYALQKQDRVIKYVKSFYVRKDGSYVDLWPFASSKSPEQLDELIKSFGFYPRIPDVLLQAYNGDLGVCNEVRDLAKQIKDLEYVDDNKMCMVMQLVIESKEEDN